MVPERGRFWLRGFHESWQWSIEMWCSCTQYFRSLTWRLAFKCTATDLHPSTPPQSRRIKAEETFSLDQRQAFKTRGQDRRGNSWFLVTLCRVCPNGHLSSKNRKFVNLWGELEPQAYKAWAYVFTCDSPSSNKHFQAVQPRAEAQNTAKQMQKKVIWFH